MVIVSRRLSENMFSRRTWARIEFLAELFLFRRTLRAFRSSRTDSEGPIKVAPLWLIAGAIDQALNTWLYDRDVGSIRTKPWRRGLPVQVVLFLALRRVSRSKRTMESFSVGASLGRIGYRFWYGVVNPVPGDDA